MHELAITEGIIEQALNAARKQHATEITKIKLLVGAGLSVVPECVTFYFDNLKMGTLAEKAKLEIEVVPLRVQCRKCGRAMKELQPDCRCEAGVDIVSGQELIVDYIEIEQENAEAPQTVKSGRRKSCV